MAEKRLYDNNNRAKQGQADRALQEISRGRT
jgi:hypothetical protein